VERKLLTKVTEKANSDEDKRDIQTKSKSKNIDKKPTNKNSSKEEQPID